MSERLIALPPFIPPEPYVLLLGSMPSAASLQQGFFYAHPRNRLWQIVGCLVGRELITVADKKAAAAKLHLALYDVIKSCRREGSLDSAVREVEPADIGAVVQSCPTLRRVITNGALAARLYRKYNGNIKLEHCALPSTSPANARMSLNELLARYGPCITGIRSSGAE